MECQPRTLQHSVAVAEVAAKQGFGKFGAGQKDQLGRVMLTSKDVEDLVKAFAKEPNSGMVQYANAAGGRRAVLG